MKMTKVRALKELEDCIGGDTEGSHAWADEILLEFLEYLGHKDVVDAWRAITPKWYA